MAASRGPRYDVSVLETPGTATPASVPPSGKDPPSLRQGNKSQAARRRASKNVEELTVPTTPGSASRWAGTFVVALIEYRNRQEV